MKKLLSIIFLNKNNQPRRWFADWLYSILEKNKSGFLESALMYQDTQLFSLYPDTKDCKNFVVLSKSIDNIDIDFNKGAGFKISFSFAPHPTIGLYDYRILGIYEARRMANFILDSIQDFNESQVYEEKIHNLHL
jgi:hypothetical protein